MDPLFDSRHVRRAFSRAAAGYDAAAALQAEVRTRLLESLAYLDDRQPSVVLDVGSGTGHAAAAMRKLGSSQMPTPVRRLCTVTKTKAASEASPAM